LLVHQDAFGAVDQLAGFQGLLKIRNLLLQILKLIEARQRNLDRGAELLLAIGFHKVRDHAGLARALDQIPLAVGAQEDHRRDPLLRQHLSRLDPVHVGHLDVHDHHIRPQLTRLVDCAPAVRHLANHEVTQVREHLPQIHADERLIVGDNDSCALHIAS